MHNLFIWSALEGGKFIIANTHIKFCGVAFPNTLESLIKQRNCHRFFSNIENLLIRECRKTTDKWEFILTD